MQRLSRRAALIGAGAAVATGTAALAGAPDNSDTELLARVAEFHRLYRESCAASEAWHEARDRADAHPDCPPLTAPAFDRQGHEQWEAFMIEQGVYALGARSNDLGMAAGAAANAVSAIPAQTLRGALEKLKIVRLAVGDSYDALGTGDEDLDAFQGYGDPWFGNVIVDLERLGGAA